MPYDLILAPQDEEEMDDFRDFEDDPADTGSKLDDYGVAEEDEDDELEEEKGTPGHRVKEPETARGTASEGSSERERMNRITRCRRFSPASRHMLRSLRQRVSA